MATIEFRDGTREVPDHLAVHMRGMDTYRVTYKEALVAVNRLMQVNFINRAANRFVDDHFRRQRGGGW